MYLRLIGNEFIGIAREFHPRHSFSTIDVFGILYVLGIFY